MKTEPKAEHRWLRQLVGDWSYEVEGIPGPGKDPVKSHGTESVRAFGDLWIILEGRGAMPGGAPFESVMTLGYDPAAKRFTGTWIGSSMAYLWIYEGELDATGAVLTLESEGPAMGGDGTMARYRDVVEIKSPDHRVMTSSMLAADGQWRQFMTMHSRRNG